MADIRKRTARKGTTYQVRYPSNATESGYAYATFATLKEARHFAQREIPDLGWAHPTEIKTVDQAIGKWLDACRTEGRRGRDPVSPATMRVYQRRAEIMRAYSWNKTIARLTPTDLAAFRSWLLNNHPRDLARKVLSSFHSVVLEMMTLGVLNTDPAAQISIKGSRYQSSVQIPSMQEVLAILGAADRLANHKNQSIAKAWQRYRPMLYLAADSGMRPQEYIVLPRAGLAAGGVKIVQALDRSNLIGPPKIKAGRRFIPVATETLDMCRHYAEKATTDLVFAARNGSHQSYDNFLKRGWHTAIEHAGLMIETERAGRTAARPKYSPYCLRHFFASMLIEKRMNLKFIQTVMGHADIRMTLDVYGHLIQDKEIEQYAAPDVLGAIRASAACGESVAHGV
jgi:integrase